MLMIDDFRPVGGPIKSLQENKNTLKAEPTFVTPDEIAQSDVNVPQPILGTPHTSAKPSSLKPWQNLKFSWPPNKKTVLISLGVILLLTSGVGAVIALNQPTKAVPVRTVTAVKKVKPVLPPKPTTVASNLSGLQVDPSLNAKPVIGVMIENSPDARPQSGLSQASVVYEAIAEGGITRFLALFQDTNPANIGPIRSVRPYFLQWDMGFDAPIAHVGGSPEALAQIKSWGAKDLDQFFNGGSYHRISSRYAPHNVYTAVDTLTSLAIAKGYTTSSFTPWPRKAEAPSAQVTAKNIDLQISGAYYNVSYAYDKASNSYHRSEGGAPHMDANGNVQISPKVVIALVMPYGLEADAHHSVYGLVGSGEAIVFQDGISTIGQWHKADYKGGMTFTNSAGAPLPLNPGQTWLTAVTSASNVVSAP